MALLISFSCERQRIDGKRGVQAPERHRPEMFQRRVVHGQRKSAEDQNPLETRGQQGRSCSTNNINKNCCNHQAPLHEGSVLSRESRGLITNLVSRGDNGHGCGDRSIRGAFGLACGAGSRTREHQLETLTSNTALAKATHEVDAVEVRAAARPT